jgi:hypothetical protein
VDNASKLAAITAPGDVPTATITIPALPSAPASSDPADPPAPFKDALPDYTGVKAPDPVDLDDVPDVTAITPVVLDDAPESPKEAKEATEGLLGVLEGYDAESYLTAEIKSQIDTKIGEYSQGLDSVSTDVDAAQAANEAELAKAYGEYNLYLSEMHSKVLEAKQKERDKIATELGKFYNAKQATSLENVDLMQTFADMAPESRTTGGINKEMVRFVTSPVEMSKASIREETDLHIIELNKRMNTMFMVLIALVGTGLLCVIGALLYGKHKIVRDTRSLAASGWQIRGK